MYINIYGKRYPLRQELTVPSRTILSEAIEKMKRRSEDTNLPELYVAFIVTMYVVSSSILSEFSDENIKAILEKDA